MAVVPDNLTVSEQEDLLEALRYNYLRVLLDDDDPLAERSLLLVAFRQSDRELATEAHLDALLNDYSGEIAREWNQKAILILNREFGPDGLSQYGAMKHPSNPAHRTVFQDGPLAAEMIRHARSSVE